MPVNFIRLRGIVHSVESTWRPPGDAWKYAKTHCGLSVKRYNTLEHALVTCLGCIAAK